MWNEGSSLVILYNQDGTTRTVKVIKIKKDDDVILLVIHFNP
jgi:hypothetical protein